MAVPRPCPPLPWRRFAGRDLNAASASLGHSLHVIWMSFAIPPQHSPAWKEEFTGQLAPRHPLDGGLSSPLLDATGNVVPNACAQIGPHHSLWLRVSDPCSPDIAAAITHQASTFTSGALYVTFDEWRSHPLLLNALRHSGFKFHAHSKALQSGGMCELVYYKWCSA
jgi:hypothetical protein